MWFYFSVNSLQIHWLSYYLKVVRNILRYWVYWHSKRPWTLMHLQFQQKCCHYPFYPFILHLLLFLLLLLACFYFLFRITRRFLNRLFARVRVHYLILSRLIFLGIKIKIIGERIIQFLSRSNSFSRILNKLKRKALW